MQSIAYLHVLIGDDRDPLVEHRHDHLRANRHAIRRNQTRSHPCRSDAIRRNQTQSPSCQSDAIRRNHLLADQMLVALIRRMHAHSGIAKDRLWPCRGHSHVGFGARFGEHVLEVVELACAYSARGRTGPQTHSDVLGRTQTQSDALRRNQRCAYPAPQRNQPRDRRQRCQAKATS